jgi:hypothetical protein
MTVIGMKESRQQMESFTGITVRRLSSRSVDRFPLLIGKSLG